MIHSSKKKKKDSSSKRIKPDDNLDEYFGLSQGQNSQETVDVTPMETPKKSEEAKLKNDPDSSSHRRGDRSPSLKSKQSAQHAEGSSHRKVDRSPQGSACEGSPRPSSESKESAHKRQSQSLKIHHHQAAQAVTVSLQMRRRFPQRER